ncbi:MAG: hypothetical protein MJ134_07795 [Lachnospiraceae bacterium]|nr:hypothetical protein [Lachnospiraceae bacterium]
MEPEVKVEIERIRDENNRQNKRLDKLETLTGQIHSIVIEIQKISLNMEMVMEELKKQGDRLEKIEEEPGETWKKVKSTTISEAVKLLVSAAVGALIVLASKGF